MKPRIGLAKLLIRLGKLLQSSALVVMRPDDLMEFSRQNYAKEHSVENWSDDQIVDSGLYPHEKELLKKINLKGGRLLLLGLGGGREAIPLSKLGFKVTGIDFIHRMVEQAKRNAERQGVKIEGLVQDLSHLSLPDNEFDVAWLSAAMYSCVPTQKRRVSMLKKIHHSLKPGGYFILGFFWNPHEKRTSRTHRINKVIAHLTWGNREYEPGDSLRFNQEFIHQFSSIDKLKSEFMAGDFSPIDIQIIEGNLFAGAVLQKPL